MKDSVVPYGKDKGGKKEQVEQMFDNISGHYDFLNHFLSLGIDITWRKKALKFLNNQKPNRLLDVASGTGDFAIMAHKKLQCNDVVGVDISNGMLEVGRKKIKKQGLESFIVLENGDSENLPYETNSFDAVIVAFGVRNFENLEKGLTEMSRILKPNGEVVVLEFSKPKSFPFKQLYNFYFNNILPGLGKIVSKDNSAYTYLPESVKSFPDGDDFLNVLKRCNYKNVRQKPLTLGIASIYHGFKA